MVSVLEFELGFLEGFADFLKSIKTLQTISILVSIYIMLLSGNEVLPIGLVLVDFYSSVVELI